MDTQHYPRCNRFQVLPTLRPHPKKLKAFLSACILFTHYLTAFLTYVKDFQQCDLDREELLLSALDYKADLLKVFHRGFDEFRASSLWQKQIALFDEKFKHLDAILRDYPRSQKSSKRDSDQINACPPLELFLRCVFMEKHLDENMAQKTEEKQTEKNMETEVETEMKPLAEYLKLVASKIDQGLDNVLAGPLICGMPRMMHLGLAKPQKGNAKLLFMGFTQEFWPRMPTPPQTSSQSTLQDQCHQHRKDRFSNQQLQEHRLLRDEFFGSWKEMSPITSKDEEEKVQVRLKSIDKFQKKLAKREKRPGSQFSSAMALSFPKFEKRDRCVTCRATTVFPTLESGLEELVRARKSLDWDIKENNTECAEIMTQSAYDDFISRDSSSHSFQYLAPPKH